MLDHLRLLVLARQRRFPEGKTPLAMSTRLAEECGELAAEVQHWEGLGLKREKHGDPDPTHTAKEVRDVLACAVEIALHYDLLDEVRRSIDAGIEQAAAEGLLSQDEVTTL